MTIKKTKITVDNKEYEVYKLDGRRSYFCKSCEKYGRYGVHWTSWGYKLEENGEVLCYQCLIAKLKEFKGEVKND